MASIALYYPWMHFQSDDWLKSALLTWGRIVRIRPEPAEDRDSDVVRAILDGSNLIKNHSPSYNELDTVNIRFATVLQDFESLGLSRFDVTRVHPGDPDVYRFRQAVSNAPTRPRHMRARSAWLGSDLPLEDLYWIYGGRDLGGKMAPALARTLRGLGLAAPDDPRDPSPWVGVHPRFGSIYGAALADAVARSLQLSPVTDSPVVHRAPGALDRLEELFSDEPLHWRPDLPIQAYLDLTVQAAIRPASLHAVSIDQILAFRERHASELAAFREHIASLAPELEQVASIESPEIARLHLESIYERTTKKQLNDLRKALRSFGVETTVGSLGIKVDMGAASSTVLGVAAAAEGHVAVGAAAVAMSVLPYAVTKFQARQQLRTTSPVAYLLAAERDLRDTKPAHAAREESARSRLTRRWR